MNVTDLKKVFKVKTLNKDEILFKEGETDGEGYIIETGTISLIKNNIRAEILGPGEVLGVWKVFFKNEGRFFTAVAEEKTNIIILPEKYLEEKVSKADPFIKHCFRSWLDLTRKFMMGSK